MAVIKPKKTDDFSTLSSRIQTNSDISNSFGYSGIDDYTYIPTVSISDTLSLGNITSNGVWTTTGTGLNWSGTSANIGTTIGQSGKVSLNGKEADVEINGKSLKTWMEQVEARLNILVTNPELEKEWNELRKLGEKYRKLEKKCKEKAEVWKKLKSMPPPDLA